MTEFQIDFNPEICLICGVVLDENKVSLLSPTKASEKLALEYFEEITNLSFQTDVEEAGFLCQTCFDKLNEIDDHLFQANSIKSALSSLFEQVNFAEEEQHISDIIDDSNVEYYEVEKIDDSIIDDEIKVEYDKSEIIYHQINEEDSTSKKSTNQVTRNFECDICQKSFKEKSKLKAHRLIHTNERNVSCPECGKKFKTRACVRSHRRIHRDDRYFCDQCGKPFLQKAEIARHIKALHLNIRDFKCENCSMTFVAKSNLKAHQLTHTGGALKDKQCVICSMAFPTNAKLKRHLNSHTQEKNFACGICDKKFLYSYNVTAHIKHVHEGQKRKPIVYTCKVCNNNFTNSLSLRKHYKVSHMIVEAVEITEGEYEECS